MNETPGSEMTAEQLRAVIKKGAILIRCKLAPPAGVHWLSVAVMDEVLMEWCEAADAIVGELCVPEYLKRGGDDDGQA